MFRRSWSVFRAPKEQKARKELNWGPFVHRDVLVGNFPCAGATFAAGVAGVCVECRQGNLWQRTVFRGWVRSKFAHALEQTSEKWRAGGDTAAQGWLINAYVLEPMCALGGCVRGASMSYSPEELVNTEKATGAKRAQSEQSGQKLRKNIWVGQWLAQVLPLLQE